MLEGLLRPELAIKTGRHLPDVAVDRQACKAVLAHAYGAGLGRCGKAVLPCHED